MAHPPTIPGSEPIAHAPKGTTVESLLTPTGPESHGYVQLGQLKVESAIFADFKSALGYLAKDSEARDQLYALVHGRTEVDVRSTGVGNDEFGARDGRPTISWAPHGALLDTNGSTLTPAMGLLHEMGHANRWLEHPAEFGRDARPFPVGSADGQTWTTPEERRNITGLEHRVGAALHEGRRNDHHGQPYTSRGPLKIESEDVHLVAERIAELKAQGHDLPAVGHHANSVVSYDHQKHSGAFVNLGNGEAAQNLGHGEYMMYDIKRDLHGVTPAEGVKINVDVQGRMTPAREQALGHGR